MYNFSYLDSKFSDLIVFSKKSFAAYVVSIFVISPINPAIFSDFVFAILSDTALKASSQLDGFNLLLIFT